MLRIVTAFLFSIHGAQKLFGYPSAPPGGRPPLASLYGVAGILEFLGGILVLFGLFTRPVAFILCGQMAVAYFKVHAPNGFWPMLNQGESAVFFCFVFLYLTFAGAGPWSLDALWLAYSLGREKFCRHPWRPSGQHSRPFHHKPIVRILELP